MLIAFGGLPGTGKTTIAQALARQLDALYLRIDSLEQAFIAGSKAADIGAAGYLAGYAVAKDRLRLGASVITDSVNGLEMTRSAWKNVAFEAGVRIFEIKVICSDYREHRLTVDARQADIRKQKLPTWESVRERHYEAWRSQHLIIDTATVSVEQAVGTIAGCLSLPRP